MKRAKTLMMAAAAAMVTVGVLQAGATAFRETFESYGEGATVWNDGVGGGVARASAQSPFDAAGDGRGMQLSGQTARKSESQGFSGDDNYRIQWDAMVSYGYGSGTTNQLLFTRWGSNTNVAVTLDYYVDSGHRYALKYSDGSSWIDTGMSAALNEWATYRLEWNSTTSTQSLFMNDELAAQGTLVYGSQGSVPSDALGLQFFQWLSSGSASSQTLNIDNVRFGGGAGAFFVPEPASAALLALGLLALRRRR